MSQQGLVVFAKNKRRLSAFYQQAWRFRGHIVLDGWDPEGNVVQFKQAEGS
jgi:hypothetical protein